MSADVAVIVPTHDRATRLGRLVSALERQHTDRSLDVVIVDDASTDTTPAVLDALVTSSTLRLRVHRLDRNRGPAGARNAGIALTDAPLVLFTDDDCAPTSDWVDAMARALEHADFVQGVTRADPAGLAHRGPWSRTLVADASTGRFETANMGYRRHVLDTVGGFDENFRFPYGEDIDLAWRAIEHGFSFAAADDAVVHHEVTRSSYRDRWVDARRLDGLVHAIAKQPRARDGLPHGHWASPSHPPALLAALGLAEVAFGRGRHRWLGLALTVPYLHHRTGVGGLWLRRRWPVTIPLALLLDWREIAVLLRASLRHRTLVL